MITGSKLEQNTASTPQQKPSGKVSAFFRQKKEWVKLNASYLPATATGTVTAYGSAYLAEKAGVDRSIATTVVASVSAYIVGVLTITASWILMHKGKYKDDTKKLLKDSWTMIKGTSIAQGISWISCWAIVSLSVHLGASNALAVTINKIADWAAFIPLFNYFNRKSVKEMQGATSESEYKA